MAQKFLCRWPSFWLESQAFRYEILSSITYVDWAFKWIMTLLFSFLYYVKHLFGTHCIKWTFAKKKLMCYHSNCPYVDFLIILLESYYFWSHVWCCSKTKLQLFVVMFDCKSEICDLTRCFRCAVVHSFVLNQYVFWLKVSMNAALFV